MMSTAFAPMSRTQQPAKWESSAADQATSSLLSETLCEQGSSASEGFLHDTIYSTEAFTSVDDASFCSYVDCGSASQFGSQRSEYDGRLDLLEMIRHNMDVEVEVHPPMRFLDPHSQSAGGSDFLTPAMRMIVVSWMVEVSEEFRLQQETLHMAAGLLDRFLSSTQDVPRCVLQLLAIACILLASKDLEVAQPTVEQLCAVTAHHFKPQDLLRMERIVLDVLEFRLACPTSYSFLHLLAQACSSCVTPTVLSLAMYLCELAVLEYDMHCYPHSCRASAALLLAQLSVGPMQHLPPLASAVLSMGFPISQLSSCMASLLQLQQAAYQHTVAGAAAAAAAAGGNCAAAAAAGRSEIGDLLAPLRAKFGAGCWCEVSCVAPIAAVPQAHLWACY